MGDELARYNLAVLYLHVRTHKRLACSDCTQGVGVDQDSQLAASLLAKAAEQVEEAKARLLLTRLAEPAGRLLPARHHARAGAGS